MGIRTEWGRAPQMGLHVTDEWEDAYGQGLDEGGIALIISGDDALVLEATDTDQIRAFAQRITDAADAFDKEN